MCQAKTVFIFILYELFGDEPQPTSPMRTN